MASVDYAYITQRLKEIVETDPDVRALQATVELWPTVVPVDVMLHVGIFERDRGDTAGQSLAAGTRTRFELRWEIWVSAVGEGYSEAAKERDKGLAAVETALMRNRSLQSALPDSSIRLRGGQFSGATNEHGGFVAMGSIRVTAEAVGTSA